MFCVCAGGGCEERLEMRSGGVLVDGAYSGRWSRKEQGGGSGQCKSWAEKGYG